MMHELLHMPCECTFFIFLSFPPSLAENIICIRNICQSIMVKLIVTNSVSFNPTKGKRKF